MRALLLSNSTSPGHPYLAHARDWIAEAIGDARRVAFVPYAAVTFSYDEYVRRVREAQPATERVDRQSLRLLRAQMCLYPRFIHGFGTCRGSPPLTPLLPASRISQKLLQKLLPKLL